MFEDAISLLSIFASMNTWLTPTVLFLLLNLMIGTIAITSGFTSHKPNHHHHHHHHIHHPQPPLQPSLIRSPSVLQRLKSTINFSSLYSHQPSTTAYFQPPPPPPPQQQQQQQPDPSPLPEPEVEPTTSNDEECPTLDEIYSRIKQGNTNAHYGRQNSDTKPSNGEIPIKLPQKMKKSASDKSAFNHFDFQEIDNVVENVGPAVIREDDDDDDDDGDVEKRENGVMKMEEEREDEGVDAKADDFINRFKEQLQLQRKESILRYKQLIHSRITDAQ